MMAATVISSSNHSGIWILPSNDEKHERHFKRGSAEAGDPGSNAHLGKRRHIRLHNENGPGDDREAPR